MQDTLHLYYENLVDKQKRQCTFVAPHTGSQFLTQFSQRNLKFFNKTMTLLGEND